MKREIISVLAISCLMLCPLAVRSQEREQHQAAPVVGPPNGSLVIGGGGSRDSEIRERFLELAGGSDAPIVVIPTAGSRKEYDAYNSNLAGWNAAGATNLSMLHTTDPAVANTDEFVEPIRKARGVWFNGGKQWRLADAYLNTKVHAELWALLGRGGVIGGSSAGAMIQGSYLARGDTSTNAIMMGDHQHGFGFLPNTAIDSHLLRLNRQFDLLEIIQAKPELLGIGIDENTALVVQGDRFEVIGQSYVAIYDAGTWVEGGPGGKGGPFYLLAPGDRFHLKTREPFRPTTAERPLDRIKKKERR